MSSSSATAEEHRPRRPARARHAHGRRVAGGADGQRRPARGRPRSRRRGPGLLPVRRQGRQHVRHGVLQQQRRRRPSSSPTARGAPAASLSSRSSSGSAGTTTVGCTQASATSRPLSLRLRGTMRSPVRLIYLPLSISLLEIESQVTRSPSNSGWSRGSRTPRRGLPQHQLQSRSLSARVHAPKRRTGTFASTGLVWRSTTSPCSARGCAAVREPRVQP